MSELDALASSNVTLLELVDLLKNRFHKNNSVYNNVLKIGKTNESGLKDTQNTLVQEHLATMDNLTGETLVSFTSTFFQLFVDTFETNLHHMFLRMPKKSWKRKKNQIPCY